MRAHERNYQRNSRLSQQRFKEGMWAAKLGKAETECPYQRQTAKLDWLEGYRSVKPKEDGK